MDNIIIALERIQTTYGNFLFGVTGAIFAVLLEGSRYARDVLRIFNDKFESLKDRVAKLEKTGVSSTAATLAGLSAAEVATLASGNITATASLTVALKSYTGNDRNAVYFHSLNLTAGATMVTNASVVTVTFPTPLPSPRCPDILYSIGNLVATTAATQMPPVLVPKFNSTNNCTGYGLQFPVAWLSGAYCDLSVRVRDIP